MKRCLALILALLLCGCAPTAEPPQTASPIPTQSPDIREIPFSDPGQCRLEYTGQSPWIRYVISRDQLPQLEALECYDDAFFRDHALVVLCITLNSGSIRPRIGQILRTGDIAQVTVIREADGEQLTQDLALWLLWARVDRDLSCSFRLEDCFLDAGAEEY